jgi:uncharacterized protein
MPITALFAGLLALLFIWLSIRVIGARRSAKIAIGDGGDKALSRRARVHANFAEYAPMGLLLMGIAENGGIPRVAIWLTGILLLLGRLIHAYGVSQEKETFAYRVTGMALTFTAITAGAMACLFLGVPAIKNGFGL